jgi:predicted transposase YbfD/YdcC
MRHIILESPLENESVFFDISDLQQYLEQVPDKRYARGKVYRLSMLLTLILLAKLAGEDKPTGIASWIKERREELLACFDVVHQRLPCLNTIRNVLCAGFDIDELERLLADYLHKRYGGQQSQLVVFDGKTARGTIPKGMTQGVHLLAVYLPQEGITLKQVGVDNKENEISAAPELLSAIPLKKRLVCADAMHTQRNLSVQIMAQGGDYLWLAKKNQPTLLADIERFFQPTEHAPGWHIPPLPYTVATSIDKGHGRIETRQLTLMVDEQRFVDWPGIQQVFRLERTITDLQGKPLWDEIVYGLTSCLPAQANAQQLLTWVRQYWGIENGLHYRRDATLREDATRFTNENMARAMSIFNNFIIGLTQKLGFSNLAKARRQFNASIARQLVHFSDY